MCVWLQSLSTGYDSHGPRRPCHDRIVLRAAVLCRAQTVGRGVSCSRYERCAASGALRAALRQGMRAVAALGAAALWERRRCESERRAASRRRRGDSVVQGVRPGQLHVHVTVIRQKFWNSFRQ